MRNTAGFIYREAAYTRDPALSDGSMVVVAGYGLPGPNDDYRNLRNTSWRLSDRGESLAQCLGIPAEVVWADEFDALWLTEREVRAVHGAGRLLYVISPEIHGFDRATTKRRWADFKSWHIDGLCTDYALEAQEFFG